LACVTSFEGAGGELAVEVEHVPPIVPSEEGIRVVVDLSKCVDGSFAELLRGEALRCVV